MVHVLNATNRILAVEHPDTINAMGHSAVTYLSLAKHTEAEKLNVQVQEIRYRVPGAESPHTIATMINVREAHETQVLSVRLTVPEEETSNSTQVVLNPPPPADLPVIIMNPGEKGMNSAEFYLC
jgi:hypothetical protein